MQCFKKATQASLYEAGDFSQRVKELLAAKKDFEVRISRHITQERMVQRQIKMEDIWQNIQNPSNLFYAKKRKKPKKHEESYKCYFSMSGQQCHIYGIAFNFRYKYIKLVTVIKDRLRLQRKFNYVKN